MNPNDTHSMSDLPENSDLPSKPKYDVDDELPPVDIMKHGKGPREPTTARR